MRANGLGVVVGWVVLWFGAAPVGAAVTVDSLLDEMADLDRLAVLPSPPYSTRQFSSYDRKSKSPADAAGWFANADRGHYLRVEQGEARQEHVMMDADGPGAIVRIWSANPEGNIRILLDDATEPVLDVPMKELLGGQTPGLPKPLASQRGRGWNLYFPIPYARRCKVTCDGGSLYYHIDYRTYPAGTEVTSFVRPDLERLAGKIRQVAEQLSRPAEAGAPGDAARREDYQITLEAESSGTLAELTGSGVLVEIRATLEAADVVRAAAGVVLAITFDGQQTVECPLGDFFGTAPGLNPYASLPMGVTSDEPREMWSHWRMPFASSARLAVRNLTTQKIKLGGRIAVLPGKWTDRSLLFHAKWRIQRELPARPFVDWTHLKCSGAGRFVGGALHVANPVRDWWGEGDEKIYVDGNTFPSFFGTGSEDYYGYAWGSSELFSHAYHNQSRCDGPRSYGHTSVNRFHVMDDIPFSKRLRFDMENWHAEASTRTDRSAVSYWYARPGGTDFFRPIQPVDVVPMEVPPYVVHREPGALEGEELKVVETAGGRTTVQELGSDWSNEKHLWWTGARPQDRLVLVFPSADGGIRPVIVRLTRADDYAQVQLYVNGHKAGGVIDLYDEKVAPTEEINLGPCDLVQGENRLTVEIVGANPRAKPAYLFGLDYLKIP